MNTYGFPEAVYERHYTTLDPGSVFLAYTDGITETHNAAGEQFGEDRVDNVLANCGMDSTELSQKLLAAVDEFADGVRPHDDRTMIILKAT